MSKLRVQSFAVSLGGGVATVRQYLGAGLIDELHLAVRPVLFGAGENLWQGLDLRALHVFLRRRDDLIVSEAADR